MKIAAGRTAVYVVSKHRISPMWIRSVRDSCSLSDRTSVERFSVPIVGPTLLTLHCGREMAD